LLVWWVPTSFYPPTFARTLADIIFFPWYVLRTYIYVFFFFFNTDFVYCVGTLYALLSCERENRIQQVLFCYIYIYNILQQRLSYYCLKRVPLCCCVVILATVRRWTKSVPDARKSFIPLKSSNVSIRYIILFHTQLLTSIYSSRNSCTHFNVLT